MATPAVIFPLILVAAVSYLLGSLNCALLVTRAFGKDDVRNHGSGNAGMTNMLRTYGRWPAALTAAGDFLKAVAAVGLGRLLFSWSGVSAEGGLPVDPGYIAGLFVLLGHVFPVFFRFRGGKGAMTTLGVVFVTNPVVFVLLVAMVAPILYLTRIASLGSVTGAIAYPVITWVMGCLRGSAPVSDTVCAAIIACIVLFMHRGNIRRLLSGTESRLGRQPGGQGRQGERSGNRGRGGER